MASGGIGGGNLGGVNPGGGDGFAQPMTGADYNRRLQGGESNEAIRNSQKGIFGGGLSDNQFNDVVTQAGMQSPTGRPLAGSAQFYQPVYQSQYQNYSMGNPMSISQYGQQPSFGGGFGGGYGGGFMPQQNSILQPQMNWQTGQMTQPAQQPSMFGGQMQGGGYGQFGSNNPYSPYSNSFLNMNPNIGRGTEQDKIGFYQGARGQGFNDQQILGATNAMVGPQSQSDWSYLQNQSGYGGGGYGNQFMPQMQNPYSYQQPSYGGGYNFTPDARLPEGMMGTMGGTGYNPETGRVDLGTAGGSGQYTPAPPRSSGPSQAIVGRSSQMRGTPNVMRRAEGGIASLMDDVE